MRGAPRNADQTLAFALKVSHRLIVDLRHFHLSPFFSYRPIFARTHNAKLSMASTKPMDIYSPFVTLSVEF